MNFRSYIKDDAVMFFLWLFGIFTIETFLLLYAVPAFMRLYIPACVLSIYFISEFWQYRKKKLFYEELQGLQEQLEDKYLICEIMPAPTFCEGKLLKEILKQANKSMIEQVGRYQFMQEDYKEYIELWIHEIKIPIATSKLMIENHKNAVTKSLGEELDKLDNYVEQVLYYARSNHPEKDYFIKETDLKEIVNQSIQKNKVSLIGAKFTLNLHDLDAKVKTDSKWVQFMMGQILQNAVKYRSSQPALEIYSKQGKENVVLYVRDNGIGIKESEQAKIFEKGFTGTNGRAANEKSTGIGLYLCKKLCDKLGLGLTIKSQENVGTEVKLVFPRGSFLEFK